MYIYIYPVGFGIGVVAVSGSTTVRYLVCVFRVRYSVVATVLRDQRCIL